MACHALPHSNSTFTGLIGPNGSSSCRLLSKTFQNQNPKDPDGIRTPNRKLNTRTEQRECNRWTKPNRCQARVPSGIGFELMHRQQSLRWIDVFYASLLCDILRIWKGRMTRVCASLRSTIDEPRTTPLPTGGKVYRPTNIPRKGCVMQHFGISLTCRNLTYDFGRLPKARILQRARPIHVFGWDAWVWIGVWLWSEVELIRHRLELSVDVQDIPARRRAIWASTIVR